MIRIEYKITNEYNAHTDDATIHVLRQRGTEAWTFVRPGPSPRFVAFNDEKQAREAIEREMRADHAAATRLGLSFSRNGMNVYLGGS
jgi:hypothetical protein